MYLKGKVNQGNNSVIKIFEHLWSLLKLAVWKVRFYLPGFFLLLFEWKIQGNLNKMRWFFPLSLYVPVTRVQRVNEPEKPCSVIWEYHIDKLY